MIEVPPRSSGEGPPYHAILEGHVTGGGGGFDVSAECRPGTVVVTVRDAGETEEFPDGVYLGISADDSTMIHDIGPTQSGDVFSGPVQSSVRIYSYGGGQNYRIEYDCRG